jgi:hypothetical protein
MRRLALLLIALAVVAPAASARRRTVRHPATACSFSLVPVWGSGAVGPDGLTRALVLVYGQSDECDQWAAYSPVDWITVEAAPLAAQPGAFVTVTPNPTAAQRSATLIIAGVRLAITQDGSARLSPPIADNLLVNGTFDRGVASWDWWRADYPNGPGVPEWSQFDANGSPASGSMLLRDADQSFNQSFQRAQCVRITPGRLYEFGAKVRTGGSQGEGLIAFLTYAGNNCSGNYIIRNVKIARLVQPGVWQQYDFTQAVSGSATGSAILLLGSAADIPPFETWFDDVYLREVR